MKWKRKCSLFEARCGMATVQLTSWAFKCRGKIQQTEGKGFGEYLALNLLTYPFFTVVRLEVYLCVLVLACVLLGRGLGVAWKK
jgi:hypothetical protein